jgi:(p)ppGpp synthase/HD superfamily hydrolase
MGGTDCQSVVGSRALSAGTFLSRFLLRPLLAYDKGMTLTSRFSDAVAYALVVHAAQRRKVSGAPYAAHLLRVAGIALEHGADEDEAMAAVLHDAIEDGGGPAAREAIRGRFGGRVVEIVDGCTDTDQTPKPPWRRRKETFLARLPAASPSVRLVVAADKLDNARSILRDHRQLGRPLWDHFRGGREGTLWYYRAVVEVLKQAGTGPLLDELDETVRRMEQLV